MDAVITKWTSNGTAFVFIYGLDLEVILKCNEFQRIEFHRAFYFLSASYSILAVWYQIYSVPNSLSGPFCVQCNLYNEWGVDANQESSLRSSDKWKCIITGVNSKWKLSLKKKLISIFTSIYISRDLNNCSKWPKINTKRTTFNMKCFNKVLTATQTTINQLKKNKTKANNSKLMKIPKKKNTKKDDNELGHQGNISPFFFLLAINWKLWVADAFE